MLDKAEGPVDNLPFKWFEGALLNYAENLLSCKTEKIAVYSFGNLNYKRSVYFFYFNHVFSE